MRADEKLVIWATVTAVILDGTNSGLGNLADGSGPVALNNFVPTGALATQVIPKLVTDFPSSLVNSMIQQIELFRNFGLGYDNTGNVTGTPGTWYIITSTNLAADAAFSLVNAGSTVGANLDASWMIQFVTDGVSYTVTSRSLQYVFASVIQTRFTFDGSEEIYDSRTGLVINDFVKILKSNSGHHRATCAK